MITALKMTMEGLSYLNNRFYSFREKKIKNGRKKIGKKKKMLRMMTETGSQFINEWKKNLMFAKRCVHELPSRDRHRR